MEYIVAFSERMRKCVDVDDNKALFHFVDGLSSQLQVWVLTQKPQMLQDAMQITEEIGSTLALASSSSQTKEQKQSIAVLVYVGHHQRNGDYVVPMELGAAMKFIGKFYLCGKPGHKAADCYAAKHYKTASQPAANHT